MGKYKVEIVNKNSWDEKDITKKIDTFQKTFSDVASKFYSDKFLETKKDV